MTEPWFDPYLSFLPGTLLGAVGGSGLGVLAGVLAPMGKAKPLVYGFNIVCFASSVVLLIAGITGLVTGQPTSVWYALFLPGLIGTILFGMAFWIIGVRYQAAEALRQAGETRRMQAQDL
ncbi:MAG TPA: hypothetical protein PKD86_04050 [Gemmatales bacterium]|nr:hypothetical protein [Gemmatales bacterium]HMP58506.1 hypothetical protein [Gemmatales bacterium]